MTPGGEYVASCAATVLRMLKYPKDVLNLIRKLDDTVERMRSAYELS